ncbi:MAG: DUF1553 domain-containing protein [Armatimonadetes bacterium]|nr:DUF1553 domain-containing protein [Armatimonadota bacterium]
MIQSRPVLRAALALTAACFLATGPDAGAAPRRSKTKPTPKPAGKPAPKAPAAPAFLKELVSLDVMPASATLDGPRAVQNLVVVASLKDGTTHDVTDRVAFTVSDSKLARVSAARVQPVADGQVRITAALGGVTSPPCGITIRNAKARVTSDFVNDVEPILAKAGCNMTACHGSPAGKGGLKLSLFGYEPELDHKAIVQDAEGKRVNLKDPAGSLLLKKATMAVPHAGGPRFKSDSPEYRALLTWLQAGAPGLGEFETRVQRVEVIPEQPWLPSPTARQRLVVTAHLSDGTTQDVTEKALFSSNDDAIAAVDGAGLVSAKRAGETAIMVRYLGQVGVSRIAVLPPWKLPTSASVAKHNYVDEHVQARLQKLRVQPSELCTDEEFLRRAMLDTCGIIPTPEEVRKFSADRSPDKRVKLVDSLLERPEFVDLWTLRWSDVLRNNPRLTRRGFGAYHKWIRDQVAANRPWDEFVREIVTASGRSTGREIAVDELNANMQRQPRIVRLLEETNKVPSNPATNYFVVSRDPLDATAATSQIFLGVRIECARCHNHPFEKWTQNDFYGLAAFFSGIQVQGNNQTPWVVRMGPAGRGVRDPKTNEVVEPKTLDNAELKLEARGDRRGALAAWLTSPENPFFARATANRIWGHYFGRGIVEPVDDLRVTNPASNPELLDALGKDLAEHKFDLKHLHRTILNSRTYQQSSKPNQYNRQDTTNFARFYPKRLMAEQLYDSISQATGVFLTPPAALIGRMRQPRPFLALAPNNPLFRDLADAMPERPMRVMQLPLVSGPNQRAGTPLAQFLNTFGKPAREVVCECERSADGNINQALALINGEEVNQKIDAPFGRVQFLLRNPRLSEAQIIEELYLASLSRRPDSREIEEAMALIRAAGNRSEGVEDLAWSLMNSREFLFNH